MHPSLEKYFNSLEQQRTKLLTELSPISGERLILSKNGKWSISQILGHIIAAEKLSVGYINKKINAINEVGSTGVWGEVVLGLYIISQRLPFKYKAPKALGNQPKLYLDLASLENEWNEVRQELKTFLEKFPPSGLKKKIYRHPVMRRCNILHALISFREHIIHHYPQIKRQL
jgi:hypothetical protein